MEVETTPKSTDLMAIIALLSLEADALRERIGQCEIRFKKRVFTKSDLEYGQAMCSSARKLVNGAVELRMDS